MGLLRRIYPKRTDTALSALLILIPHRSSDLLSQVDQPLQVLFDVDTGKEFIVCEYNRDADSFRCIILVSRKKIMRRWMR
ncbi:unnamed protein product [Rhodiola kirilowii]